MTMLTDDWISRESWKWGRDQPSNHLADLVVGFEAGARFARDRYEAREKLWRELAGRMTAYSGDWDRVKELRTALGIDKEGA